VQLRAGKLVLAGVIQSDEIHAVAGPVIPRLPGIGGIAVGLALGLNLRTVQEAGKLCDVAIAGHGLDRLVIAAAEKHRKRAKRCHLMFDEVVPGVRKIGGLRKLAAGGLHGLQILIGRRYPAKVAQMPVEGVFFGYDLGRDGGHDKIAAVTAVTGDGKGPRGIGGLRAGQ